MAETIDNIIAEMRLGRSDGYAYIIGRAPQEPLSPSAVAISYTIERVTVAQLAVRLEAAAKKWRDALTQIAHYCDNRKQMDDPYNPDAHRLSHIAQLALVGEG